MPSTNSLLFQAAKLGDIPKIVNELEWARDLIHKENQPERVYGASGGALSALAYTLGTIEKANGKSPDRVFNQLIDFLSHAKSRNIRHLNLDMRYGFSGFSLCKRNSSR